ncbi:hypothetical protein BP00DRAFT_427111 [Aspergillus indologenus CBS 114.80]|uniref:Uncharacterized protein n=1 Tax=Aspergillus indologenus CBS 114.80 TaxID=1450541 RepID=A0A2V5HZF1_9EURO|nr:hypothetical protein BP00DRAFT_427111 [Aspergillus indologenus CBS 114.80]
MRYNSSAYLNPPIHPHLLTYCTGLTRTTLPNKNKNTHNLDHHTMPTRKSAAHTHNPHEQYLRAELQKSEIRWHASNLNHGERGLDSAVDSHLFPTGRGLDSGGATNGRTDPPKSKHLDLFTCCQTVGIGMLIGSQMQIANSHDNLFSKA